MLTIKLRYILEDVDRHGNVRIYFRKRGQPMVRMRHPSGSAEFMAQYHAFLRGDVPAGSSGGQRQSKPDAATWRGLCVDYFRSADFIQKLDAKTQTRHRRLLEATFLEPIAPGAAEMFGDMPIAHFTARCVRVLRDRKAETPESANMRLKAIRRAFKWALRDERSGVVINPAHSVEFLHGTKGGFHSWTLDEVEKFEARYDVGTKPRLAFALMLYLGVRRSDLVLLGRQHLRDGILRFTAFKGRKRHPTQLALPVLPELQRVIDASPCGDLTFLVTSFGGPFTSNGFGNRMRKWCDGAKLPECSSHGLRKAGATIAAENGATDHQLMAIFGWRSIAEAQRYTKAARQGVLAQSGMPLLVRGKTGR